MRIWVTCWLVLIGMMRWPASVEAQPPQNHVWLRQHIDFIYQVKPLSWTGSKAYNPWMRLIARAFQVDFRFLMHCNNHIRGPHKPLPVNTVVFIPKWRMLSSRFINCLDIKDLGERREVIELIATLLKHRTVSGPAYLGEIATPTPVVGQLDRPARQRQLPRLPISQSGRQTSPNSNQSYWWLGLLLFLFVVIWVYTLLTIGRLSQLIYRRRLIAEFMRYDANQVLEIIASHGHVIERIKLEPMSANLLGIVGVVSPNASLGDSEQLLVRERQIALMISQQLGRPGILFKFRRPLQSAGSR